MNVLLAGVVGSTAYGLSHPGSDTDVLGMFAAPTEELHGLRPPRESLVSTDPDTTYHEAGKALRLILGGNPTAGELLWLDTYQVRTPLGEELVALRGSLLSERGVRDAYLGYAAQQFRKLLNRGPDQSARAAKHARHLVRLLLQAEGLHRTGVLTVRLDDPEHVRRLGVRIAEDPDRARPLLARAEAVFRTGGVLPEQPDRAAAEDWLRRVRRAFFI